MPLSKLSLLCWVIMFTMFTPIRAACAQQGSQPQDLTQLSIEQLMQQKVTSVSKTRQNFSDSAAAVFVISEDDIRRSGATLLPEVLRMVPGLHVARLSSNQWAITARGFNGAFSNKLLVLVDGRAVYTPIFSGVYWESLDIPLTDILRIEVIRGPGASLWGANAVNGIINIIQKSAKDSQGVLTSLGVGSGGESVVDLALGSRIDDESLNWLVSGRSTNRDGLKDTNGGDAEDDWISHRGGLRLDWQASPADLISVQADIYQIDLKRNYAVPLAPDQSEIELNQGELSGMGILTRWGHSYSLASRTATQFYYQRENRDDLFSLYRQETIDADFQHEFATSEAHTLTWGLSHRVNRDVFDNAVVFNTERPRHYQRLSSAFVQSQLGLLDRRLDLILGTKAEHNNYTGWEHQPSIKALWKLNASQRLWASIGRAARIPSRGEHIESTAELFQTLLPGEGTPVKVVFVGHENFDSEKVTSYELGYRFWTEDRFVLDLAAFYSEYEDLRSSASTANSVSISAEGVQQAVRAVNAEEGQSFGLEVGMDWRPGPNWRLRLGYSYLQSRFSVIDRFSTVNLFPPEFGDNRAPLQQASLQSSFNLSRDLELDLWLRYVDSIDAIQISSSANGIGSVDDYLTMDLRLAWRPVERLELSISARNLADSSRIEFLRELNTVPGKLKRQVFGQLVWRF